MTQEVLQYDDRQTGDENGDVLFHARQISNFAHFDGDAGALHWSMYGEPMAAYHYGSYVVSALMDGQEETLLAGHTPATLGEGRSPSSCSERCDGAPPAQPSVASSARVPPAGGPSSSRAAG